MIAGKTNTMAFRKSLFHLVFMLGMCPLALGFQGTGPSFQAVRIDQDIRLTGKLDDPNWAKANQVELSYEMQPGENTPASQKTFAKILYNSEFIYFGFDCRDTKPSEIRAHITDRDKFFEDDFAIALFDTYGDNQKTYEFFINPYGVQGDILNTGNNEDASFDAVWYSAAAMNDSGWTAEFAIPFKSIRFPAKQEQVWNLLLGRNFPRDSRYIFSWTPISRNNPCLTCQGKPLTGIRDIESTSSVEMLPFLVGTQSGSVMDSDDPSSQFVNGKVLGRVGGGVRYSPSPDFSVDAVVNPDFSQVESDAGQISVNTTFALSYPEKRPFFQLGTDLFQVRSDIFYSRAINNPFAAAKVVGKSGSISYAYLAATDRNTPFIIPGEEESDLVKSSLESFTNAGRARYDFGDEAFIGALVTTRNVSSGHNYVGGIDWNYKFWENYYLRGELFYAETKELDDPNLFNASRVFGNSGHTATFDGETYGGGSYRMDFIRRARDYSFSVQYRDEAPTFQAHIGRVNSNDVRTINMEHNYTIYPNNSFMDQGGAFINTGLRFNHQDVRKERWFVAGGYAQLKGQTSVSVGNLFINDENFRGISFEKINRSFWNLESRPLSSVSININLEVGRFIRRSDTPELGTGHNISVGTTLKPTSQFQLNLSYDRARLSSLNTGELFYDGYVARSTGIYQFTPEIFLRVIGQYDSFDRSVEVYPLLSYKLNPFTIFYAGSTSSLLDYGDPSGIRQTARQYFVKLQYLWRS